VINRDSASLSLRLVAISYHTRSSSIRADFCVILTSPGPQCSRICEGTITSRKSLVESICQEYPTSIQMHDMIALVSYLKWMSLVFPVVHAQGFTFPTEQMTFVAGDLVNITWNVPAARFSLYEVCSTSIPLQCTQPKLHQSV
jgi:hypothetical protein